MRIRRTNHTCRGTALVEFSLVCLLLFLLLGGIIEFGLEFFEMYQINQAARVGARSAAIGDPTATIRSKIKTAASTVQILDANILLRYSTNGGATFTNAVQDNGGGTQNTVPTGDLIKVHIDIPYTRLISLIPGGTNRRLTSDAVMQREG